MAIDPLLTNTMRVGELPPASFDLTDKLPHEKGTNLFSGTIQQLIDILRLNVNAFQYEIKQLKVDSQYVLDNFDETGLGKNLCLGWAITNGNNGTDDLDGLTIISYGTKFNTLGQFGGYADATLVEHTHLSYGFSTPGSGGNGLDTGNVFYGKISPTTPAGTSGLEKNRPPYIVYLTIQKL